MIPLLLIGLVFSSSTKMKKQLEEAESVPSIQTAYQSMQRRIKAKTVGGMIFFAALSNFFLLYIICFCHAASSRQSEAWVRSSGFTVFLDLMVLELIPSILFAVAALLYSCCRSSKAILCFILAIEVYRVYRNLI